LKKPLIIAHRGASGYIPENTMKAFEKALEMKSDGIELDVHMSKDGHLIVCHDERVDRTTNGSGFIKDLSLLELKELDAGSWFNEDFTGEKIPTLDEVFELIEHKDIIINIELKSGPIIYDGIEKKVIDLLKKFNLQENAIISSFNHYSLVESKKIDKSIKTAVLYMEGLVDPWKYAQYIEADGVHPLFYNIVPQVVEGCLKNNMFVIPFTVNEEDHLKKLLQSGITGVITNYPDRARKILDNLK